MSKNELTIIRVAATRAGITKESFGQWMNLARRAANNGNKADAKRYAQNALNVHRDWPSIFGDIQQLTLSRAQQLVWFGEVR